MSHVLVRDSDDVVRGTIAAWEDAPSGETKRELADSFTGSIFIGGTATVVSGKITAITDPTSTVTSRREEVRAWLAAAELEPIANWGLRATAVHRDRSRNTWWWLEMICTAAQTDSNLTSATQWGKIKAEMDWGVRKWYDEHTEADWDGLRSTAGWYSTETNGDQGSLDGDVTMKNNSQTLAEFLA